MRFIRWLVKLFQPIEENNPRAEWSERTLRSKLDDLDGNLDRFDMAVTDLRKSEERKTRHD